MNNPQSERSYALVKAALAGRCACEPYEDVFTLRKWNDKGYRVIKGERARCRIEVPVTETRTLDGGAVETVRRWHKAVLFCRCQVEKVGASYRGTQGTAWNPRRLANPDQGNGGAQ